MCRYAQVNANLDEEVLDLRVDDEGFDVLTIYRVATKLEEAGDEVLVEKADGRVMGNRTHEAVVNGKRVNDAMVCYLGQGVRSVS